MWLVKKMPHWIRISSYAHISYVSTRRQYRVMGRALCDDHERDGNYLTRNQKVPTIFGKWLKKRFRQRKIQTTKVWQLHSSESYKPKLWNKKCLLCSQVWYILAWQHQVIDVVLLMLLLLFWGIGGIFVNKNKYNHYSHGIYNYMSI